MCNYQKYNNKNVKCYCIKVAVNYVYINMHTFFIYTKLHAKANVKYILHKDVNVDHHLCFRSPFIHTRINFLMEIQ